MRNDAPTMGRDEYEGLSSSFAAACRAADEKRRGKPRDPLLEWLRVVLDESKTPSIEAAYAAFDSERRKHGAARSTIEALVWALRERGISALIDPNTRRRISELNEKQLVEVGTRLQRLKPHIAAAWSPEGVTRLVATWKAVHQ